MRTPFVPRDAPKDTPPPPSQHPRGYEVRVSTDGATWSAPVAAGTLAGGPVVIPFAPVRARFVRITQTADVPDAPPWQMQELRLFETRP